LASIWTPPEATRDALILPGLVWCGWSWHAPFELDGTPIADGVADLVAGLASGPRRGKRPQAFGVPVWTSGRALVVIGEANGIARFRNRLRLRHPKLSASTLDRISLWRSDGYLFRYRGIAWSRTREGKELVARAKGIPNLRLVVIDGESTLTSCGRHDIASTSREFPAAARELAQELGVAVLVMP